MLGGLSENFPLMVKCGSFIFGSFSFAPFIIDLILLMPERTRLTAVCIGFVIAVLTALNIAATLDKQILSQQMIFAVSGIIYAVFLLYTAGAGGRAFVTVSCILATLLGIVSLANGGVLCYNTIKGDVKARTKLKQFIWTALCIAYAVFMLVMQTYCFWKL